MKFKHAKPLVLAAAVVSISAAGGAEAAVSPEKQISFLAEQAAVWGADAFYRDWHGAPSPTLTETKGWNFSLSGQYGIPFPI